MQSNFRGIIVNNKTVVATHLNLDKRRIVEQIKQ